ncbi:hypothetical protein Vadar_006774 [Vaccinium darrowii]|uniref:Uncharacterized protein n=1 Tax=Vaccinium darrowii TaxID=229202 RepID=A0ACB7YKZ6_9ERIC|nr:hypothetical protein Vadar_006774 [Vaccinium darrowii]
MTIPVVVYVGGQLVQHTDGGPLYMGGTRLHLTVERGITLDQLKFLISNAAGMASTQMTITYRFSSIRYPNPTYELGCGALGSGRLGIAGLQRPHDRRNHNANAPATMPPIHAGHMCQPEVKWDGKGLQIFLVGQVFSSKDELQFAMKKYCMTEPHTCLAVNVTQDHSNLDAWYMALELNKIVSKAPGKKIKALQEIVKKLTGGYMPSYAKTCAAKKIVIQRIHRDWDQSFVTLSIFLQVLEQYNPVYLSDDDAYDWRSSFAQHRFCLRHLGANYHRRFGKIVGTEVKITAMESQKRKFKDKLSRLKRFAKGIVYTKLEGLDRNNWAFAYDGGRGYGIEITNVAESFNGVLKEARHLPIMATVMTTFSKCVEYFNDQVVKSMQGKKANGIDFNLFAKKKYDRWNENAVGHTVIVFDPAAGLYEVHTPVNPTSPYNGNHKHTVQLPLRRCTCNKLQPWKIPCSHVIVVYSKMSIDPHQYFSKYWSVDTTIAMYGSLTFKPLPDVPTGHLTMGYEFFRLLNVFEAAQTMPFTHPYFDFILNHKGKVVTLCDIDPERYCYFDLMSHVSEGVLADYPAGLGLSISMFCELRGNGYRVELDSDKALIDLFSMDGIPSTLNIYVDVDTPTPCQVINPNEVDGDDVVEVDGNQDRECVEDDPVYGFSDEDDDWLLGEEDEGLDLILFGTVITSTCFILHWR